MASQISEPNKHQARKSSRGRIGHLRQMSAYNPPIDFDPDVISWVTPKLAVTDWEGGVEARTQGHFVVCVAEELPDYGHVCIPVDPNVGRKGTIKTLDKISRLINWVLCETEKSVVVHCAMGMERSVLAVVWYLYNYQDMTIDEAYDVVGWKRPIAADRREWVMQV
ncbi:dual specificity protein phosphatase family protein [Dehalococcoidia bacterium]|nr:dual specificity protein phosphatase family protein [Dehalococcoidia bacterium]